MGAVEAEQAKPVELTPQAMEAMAFPRPSTAWQHSERAVVVVVAPRLETPETEAVGRLHRVGTQTAGLYLPGRFGKRRKWWLRSYPVHTAFDC